MSENFPNAKITTDFQLLYFIELDITSDKPVFFGWQDNILR